MTYHSPKPGEATPVATRPTAAESPMAPSSASSSATASSGTPSASSAEASSASSSSRSTLSSSRDLPGSAPRGTSASVSSGAPSPPEKRGGVSPFVVALVAGACLGAYAHVSGRPSDAPADPARRAERGRARETEHVNETETAVEGSSAPAARAAVRRPLEANDAEARGAKKGEEDEDASSAPNAFSVSKRDVSKEEDEVFRSSADAILAAADAAADAARRADAKDGAAARGRGSGAAAGAAAAGFRDSELEGPARAARGKALEAVAATAATDTTVSRLARARSKRAGEETAELTPTALVAASFQGAAEVRFIRRFFSRPSLRALRVRGSLSKKKRCYTQLPGPSRAESVFSRSQKNVRAAALVAQFIAPSRNAGRVMESGSPPASPKTPDDIRRRRALLSCLVLFPRVARTRVPRVLALGDAPHRASTHRRDRRDRRRTSSARPRRSAR